MAFVFLSPSCAGLSDFPLFPSSLFSFRIVVIKPLLHRLLGSEHWIRDTPTRGKFKKTRVRSKTPAMGYVRMYPCKGGKGFLLTGGSSLIRRQKQAILLNQLKVIAPPGGKRVSLFQLTRTPKFAMRIHEGALRSEGVIVERTVSLQSHVSSISSLVDLLVASGKLS
jgi:hypothetical protein